MTNAYLLCRIADTIEDDPGLSHEQKSQFHARFVAVVKGEQDAEAFARDLAPLLSDARAAGRARSRAQHARGDSRDARAARPTSARR